MEKIIKLLQDQIGAMKDLFENEITLARMEIRTNMNRHMINHHDKDTVPDSDNYLELFKKKEGEVWRLREKLDEANKKVAELIKASDDSQDIYECEI